MLHEKRLQDIARQIATGQIPQGSLEEVRVSFISDSAGEDALLFTLVIADDYAGQITGKQAIKLSYDLWQELQREQETRRSIVEYATPQDLEDERNAAENGEA